MREVNYMLGPEMAQTYEDIVRKRNGNKVSNEELFDLILASHSDLYTEISFNRERIKRLESAPGRIVRACGTKAGLVALAAASAGVAFGVTRIIELLIG